MSQPLYSDLQSHVEGLVARKDAGGLLAIIRDGKECVDLFNQVYVHAEINPKKLCVRNVVGPDSTGRVEVVLVGAKVALRTGSSFEEAPYVIIAVRYLRCYEADPSVQEDGSAGSI